MTSWWCFITSSSLWHLGAVPLSHHHYDILVLFHYVIITITCWCYLIISSSLLHIGVVSLRHHQYYMLVLFHYVIVTITSWRCFITSSSLWHLGAVPLSHHHSDILVLFPSGLSSDSIALSISCLVLLPVVSLLSLSCTLSATWSLFLTFSPFFFFFFFFFLLFFFRERERDRLFCITFVEQLGSAISN